jgi:hypothetical protein
MVFRFGRWLWGWLVSDKPAFVVFDTKEAARRLGVRHWMVRRVYEDRLLPDAPRVGRNRVIRPEDLPAIEAALRAKGYIK